MEKAEQHIQCEDICNADMKELGEIAGENDEW